MSAVKGTPMIEKNGTGIQMAEVGSTGVEKSGTGIRRRGGLRALVEKNGTGMRAISSAVMLLAMSMATASVAQERVSGYVIVEGEQATISINNAMFSSSGQAAVFEGYSAIPMKIIDARQLDRRFAALNPMSEGSGTGSPFSEGSGTGRPGSEGSGTGSPTSEGSGTGWTGSEGSGTGSPDAFAIDVCISGGLMTSRGCDTDSGGLDRPMVVDGFAEVVIEGEMAFVLVHQLNADGSLSELATLELPVILQ